MVGYMLLIILNLNLYYNKPEEEEKVFESEELEEQQKKRKADANSQRSNNILDSIIRFFVRNSIEFKGRIIVIIRKLICSHCNSCNVNF